MKTFSRKQIAINGLLVNYYVCEGKLPAFIFLHGWRSDGSIWLPVLENFEVENSLYCLDLPGFGKSELPRESFNVESYAETVSGLISKLGLKKVVIVGHSFGGRIAIKLAAKHQGFLQGIILVDSAGFVNDALPTRLKKFLAKPLRPIFKLKFLNSSKNSIYRLIGSEDYVATPQLKETYLKIIGEDLSENMKRIDVPTMLIWGNNDKDTPIEWARRMKNLISDSRLVVLKGAGHFSFLDKKEGFLEALKSFIVGL